MLIGFRCAEVTYCFAAMNYMLSARFTVRLRLGTLGSATSFEQDFTLAAGSRNWFCAKSANTKENDGGAGAMHPKTN
jgi:hypothetical protein